MVLDVVENAFNENNINFERFKSGIGGITALESFKVRYLLVYRAILKRV